jgi:hypothetical protein
MIWIERYILIACILVGARLGGIALGTVAGIGLAIFVFLFLPYRRVDHSEPCSALSLSLPRWRQCSLPVASIT